MLSSSYNKFSRIRNPSAMDFYRSPHILRIKLSKYYWSGTEQYLLSNRFYVDLECHCVLAIF